MELPTVTAESALGKLWGILSGPLLISQEKSMATTIVPKGNCLRQPQDFSEKVELP